MNSAKAHMYHLWIGSILARMDVSGWYKEVVEDWMRGGICHTCGNFFKLGSYLCVVFLYLCSGDCRPSRNAFLRLLSPPKCFVCLCCGNCGPSGHVFLCSSYCKDRGATGNVSFTFLTVIADAAEIYFYIHKQLSTLQCL